MPGEKLKQRQGPKAEPRQPGISKWQVENKYILGGYRRESADYREIITSLCFLHNETCNIYTHLVGALLLPLAAPVFLRDLAKPQYHNVSSADYTVFGTYVSCAEMCLVLSVLYHLMQAHSHRVERFWHGMDLFGIVVVTVGTFSSGIYYVFFCEVRLQQLHWALVRLSHLPAAEFHPLTCVLDLHHRPCYWCSTLASLASNTGLAEGEDRRLGCVWCFSMYTATTWNPTVWACLYAPILWNETVSARAFFLWHWSRPIRGMSAYSMVHPWS